VACGGTSGDPTAGGASAAGGAGSTGGDGGGAAASPSGVPPCGTDPAKQPARCVDSKGGLRCKTNSGYPGDELALCNPAEADGQLVHFGPSSYDDPAAMEPFMLGPGAEEEVCLHVNTTNTDTRYFATYHGRMRPHSHHWIVTMPNKHYADETKPWVCPPQPTDRWLFGSQSPQIDVAALTSGEVVAKPGDPDYGAAHDIPPAQTLLLDLHYVNTTDQPILREAWAELSYVDPADVKVRVDLIGFYNPGISLPPLAHATTKRVTCETPKDASGQQQPVYLGLTTGHAHQRLQRLSLWHQKVDGSSELVYESRNWHEPGEAVFRDGVPNPALPMAAGQDWGAKSGYLHVLPGENVSFECEYQNDRNATVTFGDTANDEMCNIFGFYYPTVGRMWNCF
jgi:hypothetical protein